MRDLATDSDRRVIDEADLAEYDYSGVQFGQGPKMTRVQGRAADHQRAARAGGGRKPKILFTVGHGERSSTIGAARLRQARDLLGKDNFEIEEWGSLGQTRCRPTPIWW